MIFTKGDASTSDEQVEKLTMEFNIHYRDSIGSLIYLLSLRVDLSFAIHKLENFHQTLVKYILKVWYIYWGTLGTIRLLDWIIMFIWMMHWYLTYWDKLLLILRINWWLSLILVGNIVHKLVQLQEHTLYFIKVIQLTTAHIF